jgi:hypothetical protein
MYVYSLAGIVQNMTGVILPSDDQPYVEFGFRSKRDTGQFYNGVFYIGLAGDPAKAVSMIRTVIIGLVKKVPITVTWTNEVPWNHITDPGGVICDAKAAE